MIGLTSPDYHRVHFISHCPAEMAGVAGAWTQVTTHVAGTITLAVQTALAETGTDTEDRVLSWERSGRRGFYFMIAWTTLFCVQYFVLRLYDRVKARKDVSGAGTNSTGAEASGNPV